MTTGEAIRAVLAADATLTALVGTKIFPNLAPQGTVPPFVVYQQISGVPQNRLTGGSVGRLTEFRMQLDSYARTYLEAHSVADAVDAVMSALESPDLAAAPGAARDLYDDVAMLHRVSADFSVWR